MVTYFQVSVTPATGFLARNNGTMKKAFLLLALLAADSQASHQRVPSHVLDSLLTAGIDQTLRQNYASAESTFRAVARDFPDHPAGFLYQAALLQTTAMDYELAMERGPFDSLLALGQERASAMIDRNPDSPWGYFYRGTMLGYDSYARAMRGDWFGAASKGMSSASDFHRAVATDSSFYDAYAGIGTYSYWKTRKMEFIAWLPFVGDKREEGIQHLIVCIEHGAYNRFAAMSSLVSIYLDDENNESAARLALEALRSYPANRLFLWGLATALDRSGDTSGALGAYQRLLASMISDPKENTYNELVCRLNMIKLAVPTRTTVETKSDLEGLFALKSRKFPEHLRKRAESKFREAELLRGALTE